MLTIRKTREAAGMSIEALAKAARVSTRTVIRIEQNANYEPGVLATHRIAKALGVTVDDLIHEPNGSQTAGGRGQIKQGGGTNRKASATASTRKEP